jgi:hypothetical protein
MQNPESEPGAMVIESGRHSMVASAHLVIHTLLLGNESRSSGL